MQILRDAQGIPMHVGGALKDVIMGRSVPPPRDHRAVNAACVGAEAWLRDNPTGTLEIFGGPSGSELRIGGNAYPLPQLSSSLPIVITARAIFDARCMLWGAERPGC